MYTGPLDFSRRTASATCRAWVMKQLGIKAGEPCAVATAR